MNLNVMIPTLTALLLLIGCAGSPEGGAGGSCSLSCTKSVLAGDDFTAVPLTAGVDYTCLGVARNSVAELSKPVMAKFKISAPSFDTTSARSNIGFTPLIAGAVSGGRTSTENGTVVGTGANATVTPSEFAGIVTPKSEWCTDSCGVASIQVWPVCLGGSTATSSSVVNTVSISLISGAMQPPDPVTFPITTTSD